LPSPFRQRLRDERKRGSNQLHYRRYVRMGIFTDQESCIKRRATKTLISVGPHRGDKRRKIVACLSRSTNAVEIVREKAVRGRVVGSPSDSERDWADLFRRGRLRAYAQRTDQPESTPQLLNLQLLIFLKEGIGGPKMKSKHFGARAPLKDAFP